MGIKLLPFSVLFLFASGQALAQNPNPTSVTPNSGVGYTTTFTAVYSDPNGAAHIDVASLAVTPNLGANLVCTVAFEFGAFWLTNDTGTALFGPLTPGSSSAISNSQCTLSGQGSSATPNGNNLSVTFKLTFSTSYAGSKQMWMYVSDSANGLNSGFQNFGSWTVGAPQPPAVTSLNPPPGSGLYQPFTGSYSDASGGGSQIDVATIAIVPYLGSSNACVVGLEFGLFWLTNDAATGLVGPLAQGSSGTISNSQCTVSGQGASFNASGNNLTFTVPITFNASFSGTQQIWMYTSDAVTNLNSGWANEGTWTVGSHLPPMGHNAVPNPAPDMMQGCGGLPDCFWVQSILTYTPNQIYGTSQSYSTGPSRDSYTNTTSARMWQNGNDLQYACQRPAVSFGGAAATARIPCNDPIVFLPNIGYLYTVVGTHQTEAGADISTYASYNTYDNLGFVAAGGSLNLINVPTGQHSDMRYAGLVIFPGNDGVTASYTLPQNQRVANSVSVHVDAPYSALKGRHQLGFPANDIYGQPAANPYLAVVVYDATPVLVTVSPSSIVATVATNLTITGTGFGDHPTIYIAGTAYNPGAPSRNGQGQDVVNVSVTLPLSQANSSVPVYIQSNGAGGQAFFGAPMGSQQLGSPTSNTTQVQVQQPPPPTISGPNGMWYLGGASVNDNCDPNSPVSNCYQNSTQLTVTPGAGVTPPSPNSPASWSLMDPLTGMAPSYVSWYCVDAACSQLAVTATHQPQICAKVNVQTTVGGVSSSSYTVYVDWPSRSPAISWQDETYNDPSNSSITGFYSNNTLQMVSACGQAMFSMAAHEEFPARFSACSGSSGWSDSISQNQWGSWITLPPGPNAGMFLDQIAYGCGPGQCSPQAQGPANPLSSQPNAFAAQFIFAGSQDTQTLGKYFTTEPNVQVRYTDHGRDEQGTWKCPQ